MSMRILLVASRSAKMIKSIASAVLALVVGSGAAFAQATPPKAPTADAAVTIKFKAADKNSNNVIDGTELDAFKANLTAIDTDKDGKISNLEFAAAVKAGHIK
jgi:hypothetical protein